MRNLRLLLQLWNRLKGCRESLEVTRIGATRVNLRNQAFKVANSRQQTAQSPECGTIRDERLDGIQPCIDIGSPRQRTGNPVPHGPRPHGRTRHIQDTKKRGRPRHLAPWEELKVANRSRVKDKRIIGTAQANLPHMLKRMMKRRPHIVEECACGGNEINLPHQAKPVKAHHLEVARQAVHGGIGRKCPFVGLVLYEHLSRPVSLKGLVEPLLRLKRLDEELTRRQVQKREPEPRNRRDIVVRRLVKKTIFCHRSRGDDARNLAAHKALGELRILHLVAQGRRLARPNQLGEIGIERMIRYAAHRAAIPPRQRRPENRRRYQRILAEHLVEVAETEHQNCTGRYLALEREILAHHGGQFICH